MSGMNPVTFLSRVRDIVTGGGFKKVIPGIGIASLQIDAGLIVTGSTDPKRTAVGNFDVFEVTNSQTDAGHLYITVPRDYDQKEDYLKFRFLAVTNGTQDTITIDGAVYRQRAGAAISSDLDPTISGSVNKAADLYGWVEVDASGLGLKPGDALAVEFTTNAHTTDKLYASGFEVVYKSCLAYFEPLER